MNTKSDRERGLKQKITLTLSPREIVVRDRATKYSDATIKEYIKYARTNSPEYVPASAQIAQAMIAYNEMIDTCIERAERSWK